MSNIIKDWRIINHNIIYYSIKYNNPKQTYSLFIIAYLNYLHY